MDTKTKFLSLLITLGIITSMMATCKKNECVGNSYSLKETWNITIEKDSIGVGDTLTFLSKFPNKPFDYNINANIDFSGDALINTTFGVYVLKTGSVNMTSAIDSFRFLPILGRVETDPTTNPSALKQVFHQEYGTDYILKFQIIALKKGIYTFGLSDGLAKRKRANSCDDGAGILFTNSNLNNHIYFQEQFYGTTNIPNSNRTHSYCFKVK